MKTIEEGVKDYLSQFKFDDTFSEWVAADGFFKGVEFAQHWTSVKDGMPPPKKRVLVKYREYQIESVSVGLLTSMDRWVVSGCTDFANVSHWRLIENR